MKVGIIGDTHFPFVHPMYLRFVQDTFHKWGASKVVHIGDVADNHAISFHDHDPNGRSAEDEATEAERHIAEWHKAFPKALVCVGNHDERNHRTAIRAGLPSRFLRSYGSVWRTPGWKWDFSHTMDGVLYTHGTGTSGKNAAINRAVSSRSSVVLGHIHAWGGVQYHANESSTIFGMNVGCGIDCRSYAFAYGRDFPNRPMLGCGIVDDGAVAHFIPMACGTKDKYHRSRVGKKK